LAATWLLLSTWLVLFEDVSVVIHGCLLYVSFLGVLELCSAFGLKLPDRGRLDVAIVGGFVGWSFGLAMYLT
jgi:hypothetical protein